VEPEYAERVAKHDGNPEDSELARELAEQAGRRLLTLRDEWTGDQKELGKAGDRLSQAYLAAALADRRPQDAVLSEEATDDKARLTKSRVWIVDPLDGTREYGEGRADWAVHVALWERDKGLTAGAVALPAQSLTLSTATELPPPPQEVTSPMRIVVSRSRPPSVVQEIVGKLGADLDPMGSAGAKVAAVVTGKADAYVHAGGFYEWDTAAPAVVARKAGFHVSRINGDAITYNEADPLMPDILVCPPALAGTLLAAIREVTHAD
jgi:3'(2'), 5'-bisphosphate nucleotidase